MKAFDKIHRVPTHPITAAFASVEEAQERLVGSARVHLLEDAFDILKRLAMLNAALL
jgi:hypothetical protein